MIAQHGEIHNTVKFKNNWTTPLTATIRTTVLVSKYWSFKQYFISFLSTLCLLFDNKNTFPSTVWVPYGLLLKVLRLQVTIMECRIYLHIFEVFLKLATYLLHISWNSATCLLHICCSKFHVVVLHSLQHHTKVTSWIY